MIAETKSKSLSLSPIVEAVVNREGEEPVASDQSLWPLP